MKITRELLRQIRPEIEAALKAVGTKHGLDITVGSMGFSADDFYSTFKSCN
jgi:hypothetical protein